MVRNYGQHQRRLTASVARAHSSDIASYFGSNRHSNTARSSGEGEDVVNETEGDGNHNPTINNNGDADNSTMDTDVSSIYLHMNIILMP